MSESPELLALALANTVYVQRGRRGDSIETPDALLAWLREHREALDRPLERADVRTVASFQELRDAVRVLFAAAVEGTDPPVAALATLNAATAAAPVAATLEWSDGRLALRQRRARADPTTAIQAQLAAAAASLLGGPLGDALRACEGPRCVQYLLHDHPRRSYCSDGCSTRARAARYYARHGPGSGR